MSSKSRGTLSHNKRKRKEKKERREVGRERGKEEGKRKGRGRETGRIEKVGAQTEGETQVSSLPLSPWLPFAT